MILIGRLRPRFGRHALKNSLKNGLKQGHRREFMKIQMKGGAPSGDAFNIDLSFMGDHNGIHNTQA